MKHESIVVVYDSCQAIAEEIADKLGAETVSVQSMNVRQIENSQSLVLIIEFQDGGKLSPHWQYVYLLLSEVDLSGKNIAVIVAQGNKRDCGTITKELCDRLMNQGAHIIGDQLYSGTSGQNLDNWICAISLTYKTITIMQYIFIVALEFVLAFTGVALLIRYYNHKA